MSDPAHSSRRLCPFRAFKLSSSRRRLASASALNTSSFLAILKHAAGWLPELQAAEWLHVTIEPVAAERPACCLARAPSVQAIEKALPRGGPPTPAR